MRFRTGQKCSVYLIALSAYIICNTCIRIYTYIHTHLLICTFRCSCLNAWMHLRNANGRCHFGLRCCTLYMLVWKMCVVSNCTCIHIYYMYILYIQIERVRVTDSFIPAAPNLFRLEWQPIDKHKKMINNKANDS